MAAQCSVRQRQTCATDVCKMLWWNGGQSERGRRAEKDACRPVSSCSPGSLREAAWTGVLAAPWGRQGGGRQTGWAAGRSPGRG